ncbi:hypothetical protein D9757_007791 [Collybiopsis confluens]|uniref:Uncharacterized protein n=1 Tax=Collybiopsis confluens TaxID=2823264 RepID=A0A8H5HQ61_9AGAR|nr:hypothetical protein D9757_007791 [Collybiopsis confluens]
MSKRKRTEYEDDVVPETNPEESVDVHTYAYSDTYADNDMSTQAQIPIDLGVIDWNKMEEEDSSSDDWPKMETDVPKERPPEDASTVPEEYSSERVHEPLIIEDLMKVFCRQNILEIFAVTITCLGVLIICLIKAGSSVTRTGQDSEDKYSPHAPTSSPSPTNSPKVLYSTQQYSNFSTTSDDEPLASKPPKEPNRAAGHAAVTQCKTPLVNYIIILTEDIPVQTERMYTSPEQPKQTFAGRTDALPTSGTTEVILNQLKSICKTVCEQERQKAGSTYRIGIIISPITLLGTPRRDAKTEEMLQEGVMLDSLFAVLDSENATPDIREGHLKLTFAPDNPHFFRLPSMQTPRINSPMFRAKFERLFKSSEEVLSTLPDPLAPSTSESSSVSSSSNELPKAPKDDVEFSSWMDAKWEGGSGWEKVQDWGDGGGESESDESHENTRNSAETGPESVEPAKSVFLFPFASSTPLWSSPPLRKFPPLNFDYPKYTCDDIDTSDTGSVEIVMNTSKDSMSSVPQLPFSTLNTTPSAKTLESSENKSLALICTTSAQPETPAKVPTPYFVFEDEKGNQIRNDEPAGTMSADPKKGKWKVVDSNGKNWGERIKEDGWIFKPKKTEGEPLAKMPDMLKADKVRTLTDYLNVQTYRSIQNATCSTQEQSPWMKCADCRMIIYTGGLDYLDHNCIMKPTPSTCSSMPSLVTISEVSSETSDDEMNTDDSNVSQPTYSPMQTSSGALSTASADTHASEKRKNSPMEDVAAEQHAPFVGAVFSAPPKRMRSTLEGWNRYGVSPTDSSESSSDAGMRDIQTFVLENDPETRGDLIPNSLPPNPYDYYPGHSNSTSRFHYNYLLLAAIKHARQFLASPSLAPANQNLVITVPQKINFFSQQIIPLAQAVKRFVHNANGPGIIPYPAVPYERVIRPEPFASGINPKSYALREGRTISVTVYYKSYHIRQSK